MSKYLLSEINGLAASIHERNLRLGFYEEDKRRDFDGMMMNVVCEAAEAQEEWRKGCRPTETYWTIVQTGPTDPGLLNDLFRRFQGRLQVKNYDWDYRSAEPFGVPGHSIPEWLDVTPELIRRMPGITKYLKPEGIPSEMADIIIRVLDICAFNGIDIAQAIADKMAFNDTRPYRHGKKLS